MPRDIFVSRLQSREKKIRRVTELRDNVNVKIFLDKNRFFITTILSMLFALLFPKTHS